MRPDPKVLILDRLDAAREDPDLCDAIFVVSEQEFKVCSTILAMSSRYFKVIKIDPKKLDGRNFSEIPISGNVSRFKEVKREEGFSGHQPRRYGQKLVAS